MFGIPFRIVLVAALSVAVQVGVALAQEGKLETKVIPLQHLDLEQAQDLVLELYADDLDAVAGALDTMCLIVRGLSSEVQAVSEFIKEVDVPQRRAFERHTEPIPIGGYPVQHLVPLVQSLLGGSEAMIGGDYVNRQLLVSGSPAGIEAVRSLVSQIDQPTQSLRLEFSFIRGQVGTGSDSEEAWSPDLPEAMKPIVNTLRENGFGELTLMAPFIIHADAGSEFDSKSNLTIADESLQFHVEGAAQLQPGEDTSQLRLGAEMEGTHVGKREKGEPPKPKAWFAVETTVTAALGDYTILAASPSSTEEGSAVALVVRVTRD